MSEGGSLDAEVSVSAGDGVFSLKGEPGVVFVNVVFWDAIRQTADDEEVSVADSDASGAIDNFGSRVAGQFFEAGGVIGKDPRVSVTCRIIELSKVYSDEQFAVVIAKVAMMVGNRNGLQYFSLQICFDELGGEGPKD